LLGIPEDINPCETVDEYVSGLTEDLNAVQRHRKKRKVEKIDLDERLKEIDVQILKYNEKYIFLMGKNQGFNEILSHEIEDELDSTVGQLQNDIEITLIANEVQEVRAEQISAHHKRKRLHELHVKEVTVKETKLELLKNEINMLEETVNRKLLEIKTSHHFHLF